MKLPEYIAILCISGAIISLGNSVGYDVNLIGSLPGICIMLGIIIVSVCLHLASPGKLKRFPIIGWITLVGVAISMPASPVSAQVIEYTKSVNLLATATPVLAYAGISVGKDMAKLKSVGWKLAVVSIFVFAGTFLGSAIISQLVLKLQGLI